MAEIPPKETWRNPAEIIVSMVIVGNGIARMETIEHDGTLWLVPDWYAHDAEGWMRPARIVSLAALRHDRTENSDFQVVVNEPLPADLMPPNDPLETAKRTLVIDLPDIWFGCPIVN